MQPKRSKFKSIRTEAISFKLPSKVGLLKAKLRPRKGYSLQPQTAKIASENIRKPNLSEPTGTMVTAIP